MDYAQTLLEWFDKNKREMPWRKTKNPYAIWISEVMLQQTKVNTVIPYYEKFMSRFPTIKSLAEAELEEVHKYWEGLGYYRRADNLHKGAKMVEEKYNGIFPLNAKDAKQINGIGPYTLGAILSIAYDIPLPAVDGNVMRVLARQFLIDLDIAKASSRKVFEEKVNSLLPRRVGDFNEALMELGAVVCTPTSPNCKRCPMNNFCLAYKEELIQDFPVKTKKQKVPTESYDVVLLKQNDKYWMEKRPDTGLLAKLWGFPMYPSKQSPWIKKQANKTLDKTTHIFTHKKWELYPWVIPVNVESPFYKEEIAAILEKKGRWVTKEEMKTLPIGTAFGKIIQTLEK